MDDYTDFAIGLTSEEKHMLQEIYRPGPYFT
jgi:hypothetical protein